MLKQSDFIDTWYVWWGNHFGVLLIFEIKSRNHACYSREWLHVVEICIQRRFHRMQTIMLEMWFAYYKRISVDSNKIMLGISFLYFEIINN